MAKDDYIKNTEKALMKNPEEKFEKVLKNNNKSIKSKNKSELLILGICGSSKIKGSLNEMILKYCEKIFKKMKNINFKIIDIKNFPPIVVTENGKLDKTVLSKKAITITNMYNKCDGILFVSPTYNWGITSILKNFIDWMDRYKYDNPRACAVIGASYSGQSILSNLQLRQIGIDMNYLFINKPYIGIDIGSADKFKKKFIPTKRRSKNIEKLLNNLVILIKKIKSNPKFL